MNLCLSQATLLPVPFADDITACAEAGCRAIEVWLTKLEQHLERHSRVDTVKRLEDRGIALVAAAAQGGLLLSEGEARQAHYEHFRRRLELCALFQIPTLLLVADFTETVNRTALERAVVSLGQAGQFAAGYGVRLALEFQARASFCSCLETAIALVRECGQPNVGVCLDLFHFVAGPSKTEDLELLTTENLAHVQVCDLAGVPRELATDADRILPGDGDIRFSPLVKCLRDLKYQGWVSLELFNPTFWQIGPRQVAEIGLASLTRMFE